jgi:hypothetical protein
MIEALGWYWDQGDPERAFFWDGWAVSELILKREDSRFKEDPSISCSGREQVPTPDSPARSNNRPSRHHKRSSFPWAW